MCLPNHCSQLLCCANTIQCRCLHLIRKCCIQNRSPNYFPILLTIASTVGTFVIPRMRPYSAIYYSSHAGTLSWPPELLQLQLSAAKIAPTYAQNSNRVVLLLNEDPFNAFGISWTLIVRTHFRSCSAGLPLREVTG